VTDFCPHCGKRRYPSRQAAEQAARDRYPGDTTIIAYQCAAGTGVWHLGPAADRPPL
jgi:hypothetical protein